METFTQKLKVKTGHSLMRRFLQVRKHSTDICSFLKTEDFVVQPVVEVSPPKWHLAHTTWFWEEFILAQYVEGFKRFNERYSFLFNSYYHSMGDRMLRTYRGNMSRPTVDEVNSYRKYVDEHMEKFLANVPDDLINLIETGINHEQQHQELLYTDIKYILGHNPLFPVYDENFQETIDQGNEGDFIEMNNGHYLIGHTGNDFSFDNEHAAHEVYLPDYQIQKRLVSNKEFLSFIKDSGYDHSSLWLSDGWDWIKAHDVDHPMYWHNIDGEWFAYTLAGLKPIDPEAPVTHISFYEASAFAEWSGMRLPTELEWEAAADTFQWGDRWEHTNSAYLPYPGYKRPAGAVGEYNGKFMINNMVLRGASVVTPEFHSRKTYRNFFHPSQRWQFNGIRLCKK